MISLEQIKLLEIKVENALQRIIELQNKNSQLKIENGDLQAEIDLLQEQCTRFEQDEVKIEQGILSVLHRLDSVEDTLRQSETQTIAPEGVIEEPMVQSQKTSPANITETQTIAENEDMIDDKKSLDNEQGVVADDNKLDTHTQGMLNHAEKSSQLDIF